jgi:hypothetical protein
MSEKCNNHSVGGTIDVAASSQTVVHFLLAEAADPSPSCTRAEFLVITIRCRNSAICSALSNSSPFSPSCAGSLIHPHLTDKSGSPGPSMSGHCIGRSRPDDERWNETPALQHPRNTASQKEFNPSKMARFEFRLKCRSVWAFSSAYPHQASMKSMLQSKAQCDTMKSALHARNGDRGAHRAGQGRK